MRRHGQTAIDVDSPDMLVLDGNSSEIEGGTAAFKMLPWFRHALASFPDVAYVSRADDDAYLELPMLMGAIESLTETHRAEAFLLGSIHMRAFWSPAARAIKLYTRPPDAVGPFQFANGQFLAVSAPATRMLRACGAAHDYVAELLHLTRGPFITTADDGLLGYLLHMCLPVDSLRTLQLNSSSAHDIRCRKDNGFGRPPSSASLVIHKLRSAGSVCYARCTRAGAPKALRASCCLKFVCGSQGSNYRPTTRGRHSALSLSLRCSLLTTLALALALTLNTLLLET